MSGKAPLSTVLAWLDANPDATKADAAREHGWHPDSLRKAITRHHERRPGLTGQDGRAAKTPPALAPEYRDLIRGAMTQILVSLADPRWLTDTTPVQRATVLGILVDKYGSLLMVESDAADSGDTDAEADRIAAYLHDEDQDG